MPVRMTGMALVLLSATTLAAQEPRRSDAAQREQVTITVYNQNFGLVREVRTVDLGRGPGELEFRDVAGQIEPFTVNVRALDGQRFRMLEQNYRYDLLSPEQLLRKYVGRTITVYRWNSVQGVEEPFQAEVLSVNQSPILRSWISWILRPEARCFKRTSGLRELRTSRRSRPRGGRIPTRASSCSIGTIA